MPTQPSSSISAQNFEQLAIRVRRIVKPPSSLSSDESESASTTSSVRDTHGDDVSDVEEVHRLFCASPHSDEFLLSFGSKVFNQTALLEGIGVQFLGVTAASYGGPLPINTRRSLSLSSNYTHESTLQSGRLTNRSHDSPPLTFVHLLSDPLPNTIPHLTSPAIVYSTLSQQASIGRPVETSTPETEPQLTPSSLRVTSVNSGVPRNAKTPNFLNPLLVLDHAKFGKNAFITRCCGCYSRTGDFIRAVLDQIEQHASELEISQDAITKAEEESGKRRTVHAKLAKIWKYLLAARMPFPEDYPVAGTDHKHRRGQRKKKIEQRSSATPIPEARTDDASTSPGDPQTSISASHDLSTSVQPTVRTTNVLDQRLSVQSDTHGEEIQDIVQHLICLHEQAHSDDMNVYYPNRISVLGSAIDSIRSLISFSRSVVYRGPLPERGTAKVDDFLAWSTPKAPQLDSRDTAPSVQRNFIRTIEQRLWRLHSQVHGVSEGYQSLWRSSALAIAMQTISFMLDEATRDMDSSSVHGPSAVIDSDVSRMLPTSGQCDTLSDISRPSTRPSGSSDIASSRSTAPTASDGDGRADGARYKPGGVVMSQ